MYIYIYIILNNITRSHFNINLSLCMLSLSWREHRVAMEMQRTCIAVELQNAGRANELINQFLGISGRPVSAVPAAEGNTTLGAAQAVATEALAAVLIHQVVFKSHKSTAALGAPLALENDAAAPPRPRGRKRATLVKVPTPPASRKCRSNPIWLKEIKRFQRETLPLIPKLVFARLVREVLERVGEERSAPDELLLGAEQVPKHRLESSALVCLQSAAEAMLGGMFSDANWCALHAKRVTVVKKDIELACHLRRCRSLCE